MGGGRPKIQKPPAEPEPLPPIVAPPTTKTVDTMSAEKEKVKQRAKRQAGRASTIFAGRMMKKRQENLSNNLSGA